MDVCTPLGKVSHRVHMCVSECGSQRPVLDAIPQTLAILIFFFFETVSLKELGTHQKDKSASTMDLSICPESARITDIHYV